MSVFNAALESTDSAVAVGTAAVLSDRGFPEFPDENPSKQDLKAWLEAWDDDLTAAGYGAVSRNQIPFDGCMWFPLRLVLS